MALFGDLFWKPQKEFLYRSGFRKHNRSSVLFKFDGKIIKATFIIKGDKCNLSLPKLDLMDVPIKDLKFKRVIKKGDITTFSRLQNAFC